MAAFHWNVATGQFDWPPAFRQLCGFSSDVPATYEAWLQSLHPDDRAPAEQQLQHAMQNRSPLDLEYRIVRPDGAERWIAAKGRFSYGQDGTPLRLDGVAADISPRKTI